MKYRQGDIIGFTNGDYVWVEAVISHISEKCYFYTIIKNPNSHNIGTTIDISIQYMDNHHEYMLVKRHFLTQVWRELNA